MEGKASMMFERQRVFNINLSSIWTLVVILLLILVLMK
jgi:hypothetical protein